MSETRFMNVALAFADLRAAYLDAVRKATETGDEDDAATMHKAYRAMEDAADTLMLAGIEWRAQHAQGVAP